jgi:hypothetical protein
MSLGLSITKEFTSAERERRMGDIEKWASGGYDIDLAHEYLKDVEIDDIDPEEADVRVRTRINFLRALVRDRDYSKAGRKRLFELGVHNAMRELYQGAKIAVDSGD